MSNSGERFIERPLSGKIQARTPVLEAIRERESEYRIIGNGSDDDHNEDEVGVVLELPHTFPPGG